MIAWPKPDVLRDLIASVREAEEIDRFAEANLTAALVAPTGAEVSVSLISDEVTVRIVKDPRGHGEVWEDWPAWQLRWAAGALDAAFGMVERCLPGVSFLYARGRLTASEPPYACQILFGAGEVLGEGEHQDGPSAVILALLNALLAAQVASERMRQASGGRA